MSVECSGACTGHTHTVNKSMGKVYECVGTNYEYEKIIIQKKNNNNKSIQPIKCHVFEGEWQEGGNCDLKLLHTDTFISPFTHNTLQHTYNHFSRIVVLPVVRKTASMPLMETGK